MQLKSSSFFFHFKCCKYNYFVLFSEYDWSHPKIFLSRYQVSPFKDQLALLSAHKISKACPEAPVSFFQYIHQITYHRIAPGKNIGLYRYDVFTGQIHTFKVCQFYSSQKAHLRGVLFITNPAYTYKTYCLRVFRYIINYTFTAPGRHGLGGKRLIFQYRIDDKTYRTGCLDSVKYRG